MFCINLWKGYVEKSKTRSEKASENNMSLTFAINSAHIYNFL